MSKSILLGRVKNCVFSGADDYKDKDFVELEIRHILRGNPDLHVGDSLRFGAVTAHMYKPLGWGVGDSAVIVGSSCRHMDAAYELRCFRRPSNPIWNTINSNEMWRNHLVWLMRFMTQFPYEGNNVVIEEVLNGVCRQKQGECFMMPLDDFSGSWKPGSLALAAWNGSRWTGLVFDEKEQ